MSARRHCEAEIPHHWQFIWGMQEHLKKSPGKVPVMTHVLLRWFVAIQRAIVFVIKKTFRHQQERNKFPLFSDSITTCFPNMVLLDPQKYINKFDSVSNPGPWKAVVGNKQYNFPIKNSRIIYKLKAHKRFRFDTNLYPGVIVRTRHVLILLNVDC